MSRENEQMKGLVALAGLQFRAVQAEMAGLVARETKLRDNLLQLDKGNKAPQRADDPAAIAGAHVLWRQWAEQRRATINTELAQVLALKENCRVKLQRAFGRDQAAQKLLTQLAADRAQTHKRRADYES